MSLLLLESWLLLPLPHHRLKPSQPKFTGCISRKQHLGDTWPLLGASSLPLAALAILRHRVPEAQLVLISW